MFKSISVRVVALLVLSALMASSLYAQEYKLYSERPAKGEYYVLVTSSECLPCQILKNRLTRFASSTIYIVDSDAEPQIAAEIRQGYRFVPYFLKMRVNGSVKREVLQDAAAVDDATLNAFMAEEVKEISQEFSGQEPVGNPLQNIFSKRFDRLDKRGQELNDTVQGLLTRFTFFERLQEKFSELHSGFSKLDKNQSRLEEMFDRFKEFKPIMAELEKAREERKGLFNLFSGLKATLEKFSELGSGFEGIRTDLKEFREERKGVLNTLKGLFEDHKLATGRLSDLREQLRLQREENRKEREAAGKDREKFRPIVNLIDRLQRGVDAITGFVTHSILSIIFSILMVLLAVFGLFLVAALLLSILFKLSKKLAGALGLSWLI